MITARTRRVCTAERSEHAPQPPLEALNSLVLIQSAVLKEDQSILLQTCLEHLLVITKFDRYNSPSDKDKLVVETWRSRVYTLLRSRKD
jgi:hypothetical protein